MSNKSFYEPLDEIRRPGVSISAKLFAFLALFTFFILIVVWVFQIGLLNYFYRETKYQELEMADYTAVTTLNNNPQELNSVLEEFGTDYDICSRVFRVEGDRVFQTASVEVSGDCMIHHMSEKFLTFLYNKAVASGGVYVHQTTPDELEQIHGAETREPVNNPMWQRTAISRINTVHVRIAHNSQGEEFIILLNSELLPLSSMVDTLETQFWMIAVILLLGALVLAVLISRNISYPIQKMNYAAKRLAKGEYDADFEVTGYREVMELSESLTHASEELSKNDKLQKELIANISHDLRTPLTMIIGYSEVMRDLPGENTPENVQVIIDETQRLSNLVNDLLDLSKLQAGTRKLTLEPFNLTDVVQNVMLRYEKLTQKDEYRIEFSYDTPVEVIADQTMILQVVYNLINNAINYTGDDKLVRVTQKVIKETNRVRISVTDSGAGIPADQIPLIWDRYYKIDKVHRRAMVGTGLGLSIVKHILEQHNTTYGVESKLGVGSTFWFELNILNEVTDYDTNS
ncbi:MAG: HAMP domain-containing histidine kinase [Clostridia bacterium]|nr:HAMP domain-containing histidine kinase [Clostridia bacterium]